MDHGRIVQVSTPGELYEYPNSRYVAEFIGEVNILEGRVSQREGDHLLVQSPEAGCAIETGQSGEPQGRQGWIAIRPEKLMISKQPPPAGSRNCKIGRAQVCTPVTNAQRVCRHMREK